MKSQVKKKNRLLLKLVYSVHHKWYISIEAIPSPILKHVNLMWTADKSVHCWQSSGSEPSLLCTRDKQCSTIIIQTMFSLYCTLRLWDAISRITLKEIQLILTLPSRKWSIHVETYVHGFRKPIGVTAILDLIVFIISKNMPTKSYSLFNYRRSLLKFSFTVCLIDAMIERGADLKPQCGHSVL